MRHRIGVVLLVPEPLATELDGLRRALRAVERDRVAPHLTLIAPLNLRDKELLLGLDAVRRAAAGGVPLQLELGPVGTFAPDTPTVHLAVGGRDTDALHALRTAVNVAPLKRSESRPFVPHVTLAQEVTGDARRQAALTAMAGWSAEVTFDRVHVLRQLPDRSWAPIADAGFAAAGIVGRGGIEVALAVTARPDPEAASLLAIDGGAGGDGRPFAVTARIGERVAGAAWGWTSGSVAIVADLAVAAAHRNLGIGRRLLDAVESEAAARGADALLVAAPGDGAAASLLAGAGWLAAGDAVADGRRLWRRSLVSPVQGES